MKRNILKSFAAITAISGLSLSLATAGVTSGTSILCIDANSSVTKNDANVTIDLKGTGVKDLNLTLIPAANYKGASFKLELTNGGIPKDDEVLLCVGDVKVGSLQEPGTIVNNLLVGPTFSFIDNDTVAGLINKDSNITFETTNDCAIDGNSSQYLNVVGLADKPCQTISAKTIEPFSTQGREIPSLKSNSVEMGTTKTYIQVACTTPECFITSDTLHFTNSDSAAGINVALTDPTSAGGAPISFTNTACPTCPTATVNAKCTTYIKISNENDDFNITGLDLVANLAGLKMKNIDLSIANGSTDVNVTKAYTLGEKFSPTKLNIGKDGNATIKLVFEPTGTDVIQAGDVVASITGMDSNLSATAKNDVVPTFTDKKIANLKVVGNTKFTVPYMNGAVSSMVKISPVSTTSETTLAADITDSNGKTCNVTLDSIPAGSSTMVFANSKAGRTSPSYQNLIDEGDCPLLETKEYSVVFSVGAQANVISYMTMSNGSQRYVDVY